MDIKILYWEINISSIGLKKLEPIQIQSSEKKREGVGIGDWDWLWWWWCFPRRGLGEPVG